MVMVVGGKMLSLNILHSSSMSIDNGTTINANPNVCEQRIYRSCFNIGIYKNLAGCKMERDKTFLGDPKADYVGEQVWQNKF